MSVENRKCELFHYGVKGQRWGVRRYQNPDGSLTTKGKKRYDKMSDDKLYKTLSKQVAKNLQVKAGRDGYYRYGNYTKEATEKLSEDIQKHRNNPEVKAAKEELNKIHSIGPHNEDKWKSLVAKTYRPDLDYTSHGYTDKGRGYTKEFLDKYGKGYNIARLKDLGYDDNTAKQFAERLLKSKEKIIIA